MTVEELIAELEMYDPKLPVLTEQARKSESLWELFLLEAGDLELLEEGLLIR